MKKALFLISCLLFLGVNFAHAAPAAQPSESLGADSRFAVAFAPKGQALALVLQGISSAQKSIEVAAYSFTSKPISEALLDARARGIMVRVVADAKSNKGKYSAVTFLANQGVPVRLNDAYAIHHHKFMVIDETHVETGSFNFSAAAQKSNAENVLLLSNVPGLAAKYKQEWQRLWDESTPLAPKY